MSHSKRLVSTVHWGQKCYWLLGDNCVDPGANLAGRDGVQSCRLQSYINRSLRSCVSWCHSFPVANISGLVQVPWVMRLLQTLIFYLNFEHFSPVCLFTVSYEGLSVSIGRHFPSSSAVVVGSSCKWLLLPLLTKKGLNPLAAISPCIAGHYRLFYSVCSNISLWLIRTCCSSQTILWAYLHYRKMEAEI